MTRPKFLLITADQHCADRIGVAGRRMKTPYLDEVSRNGTRFTARADAL